ncbi:hypothetical protein Q8W71_28465 [Methylobacterium sp. NEAU 140]|nr:hypothetical protein [Methylobacterium sp. NEAU 140]MDP4026553.1 hypothetical protein [Methylobacterium sp. NEAU 140]
MRRAPSPQPNLDDVGFGPRFWLAVPRVGVGAGLAAGLLMRQDG